MQNRKEIRDPLFTILMGPMASGKTTQLIQLARRHQLAGRIVQTFRPTGMARKGLDKEKLIVARDTYSSIECIAMDRMSSSVLDIFSDVDVFLIDEGQFMSGIANFCKSAINRGKAVIVSMLISNFKQEPFDNINDLANMLALGPEIISLTAVCSKCGCDTARLNTLKHFENNINSEKGKNVGDMDLYISLCHKCVLSHQLN